MHQSEITLSCPPYNAFAYAQCGIVQSMMSEVVSMADRQAFAFSTTAPSIADSSRFFGTWPKVDSWSEITPLMALSDLNLGIGNATSDTSTPANSNRIRSDSQCSSATSGLFSYESSIHSPRSRLSDNLGSPERHPQQPFVEAPDSSRMFNAGVGVDFNLLTEEIEKDRADPAMDKLSVLIKYLSATTSPLVTVDRMMWLDLLLFVQRRCQLMAEKDIALCVFCRNNNEPRSMYMNHKVRDREGRVSCPVLRRYECPLCHQSGDNAHTLKYCPLASSGETLTAASCFRTARNATGRRRLI